MKTIKMIMDVPIDVYSRFVTLNLGTPLNEVLDEIRAEIDGIEINGQVDEHTSFIRTREQVKQMALDIIDKYIAESEG